MPHGRILTDNMKTNDNIKCKDCNKEETGIRAFLLCNTALELWNDIMIWLRRLDYQHSRVENKGIVGDLEKYKFSDSIITVW